jgi:hypothetical protein
MAVGPGAIVEQFGSGSPKITMTAGAAVIAGRLVEMSANRTVQHAAAASLKVAGVVLQDSDGVAATGNKVAVATGGVWALTAVGAIAAGDQVIAAANGQVSSLAAAGGATAADINNARAVVGVALAAIANGQQGPILLQKIGG